MSADSVIIGVEKMSENTYKTYNDKLAEYWAKMGLDVKGISFSSRKYDGKDVQLQPVPKKGAHVLARGEGDSHKEVSAEERDAIFAQDEALQQELQRLKNLDTE